MAKYRGKHNGQTRGPYIRKAFIYSPNSEKELIDLSDKLNIFLCEKGYCVKTIQCCEDTYSGFYGTYHIAGTTIGMAAMNYEINPVGSTLPQRYLHLKLVTNDSLDDIIQKITNEFQLFSVFSEIEPDYL